MITKIKDLRVRTIIGVYDSERNQAQDILINATIKYEADKAVEKDDIDYTLNYCDLAEEIVKKIEQTNFQLLEKLADYVLEIILEKQFVIHAQVEIDKPQALKHIAKSVSVIGEREKN